VTPALYILQLGNQQNYIQFIVLILIFGFSAISWIFRKLSEQAAKKRAQELLEQRRLEALRTGRSAPEAVAAADDPEARAREQAARRRAQIEELRRRQQERVRAKAQARVGSPVPSSAPPTGRPPAMPPRPRAPIGRIPGSSGPTVPQRSTRTTEIKTIAVPRSQRTSDAPVRKQPAPAGPVRRGPDARAAEPHRIAQSLNDSQTSAQPPETGTTRALTSSLASIDRPKDPAQWRRVIILNEILSPPMGLRDPAENPGSPVAWPAGGAPPSTGATR